MLHDLTLGQVGVIRLSSIRSSLHHCFDIIITLPQIWDVDLQKNAMVVRDVLLVAQGEMALEEFMKQIREQWQTYELELVNYQNKCKLIKGWDELFTKLKENINSLTAMKLSPYFKVY